MSSFRTIRVAAANTARQIVLGGALFATPAAFAAPGAQTALQQPPTGAVQSELLLMAGQAGVIFAGEVLRVTPRSGSVEVAFRIDQPIRGCDGQSTYTLREWTGLWTGGHQRYTPGQRLLILLHAPSASGLSSPVGGQDGMIPVVGAGAAPGPTDTFVAQAEPAVDLRWVQARLPRAQALLPETETRVHSLASASSTSGGRRKAPLTNRKAAMPVSPLAYEPAAIGSGATLPLSSVTASGGITLRSILAILGAWQAQQSNATH